MELTTTIYAAAGFFMMILLMVLLITGKTTPVVAFTGLPIVFGLLLGFSLAEIGEYITAGVSGVLSVATMFVFAIIFFSIMSDVGVFDVIVGKLIRMAGNSVVLVCVVTVFVTIVGHLDGSGATTYLIAIPPLLLVYRKLKMRPIVLMCLVSLTAGVMNMVPWGGPCGRLAAALGVDATEIWMACLPAEIFGVALIVLIALYYAKQEKARGASSTVGALSGQDEQSHLTPEQKALLRPRLFWFNLALILAVIVVMMFTDLPPFVAFMGATALAMTVNFPNIKLQNERMKAYAPSCMMMASVILASGAFVGIISKSPIMDAMIQEVMAVMPMSLAPHLHIFFAVLNNPLSVLGLDHTASVYNIMPIIAEVVSAYGVTAKQVAVAYLVTFCAPVFVMPTTAAMYLGLGLTNVELKDHIRMTYKWTLLLSLAMLAFTVVTGAVQF